MIKKLLLIIYFVTRFSDINPIEPIYVPGTAKWGQEIAVSAKIFIYIASACLELHVSKNKIKYS